MLILSRNIPISPSSRSVSASPDEHAKASIAPLELRKELGTTAHSSGQSEFPPRHTSSTPSDLSTKDDIYFAQCLKSLAPFPRVRISTSFLMKVESQAEIVACCQLPPVEAEYTPKGSYAELEGLKTYFSGPEDAKSAILMVYDVFGFSPQIVQGECWSHIRSWAFADWARSSQSDKGVRSKERLDYA
jgi:hypothetical protein